MSFVAEQVSRSRLPFGKSNWCLSSGSADPRRFPAGGDAHRAATPSDAATLPPATSETQNQVSPSLTEVFALENAYFVCNNVN